MDHEAALVLGAGSAEASMPSVGLSPEEGGWGPSRDRAEVCRSRPEQVTVMLVFLEGRGHCDLPTVPEGRHTAKLGVYATAHPTCPNPNIHAC